MPEAAVSRAEAARILGVSDGAVGRIRAGSYPEGELPERYRLLVAVVDRARRMAGPEALAALPESVLGEALCRRCPREDCAGCRVLEVV